MKIVIDIKSGVRRLQFSDIQKVFIEKCKAFAKANNALWSDDNTSKKESTVRIYLNLIRIDLVYRQKGSTYYMPPSTLYCKIYLNKNSEAYFHLPELFSYNDIKDFRACYFPFIENKDRMLCCFDALADILVEYIPLLNMLVEQGKAFDLKEKQFADIKKFYSLKNEDMSSLDGDELQFYYDFYHQEMIHRYTLFDPYYAFLCGKIQKARKIYKKVVEKGKVFDYEIMLYEFLNSKNADEYNAISKECFALKKAMYYNSNKVIFLYGAVAYVPCAMFFCLLFGMLQWVLSYDTMFYAGSTWYWGFVFAGVPTLFGAIAMRRTIARLLNRKRLKEELDFDEITNSKKVNVFVVIVFVIFFIGSIVVSLITSFTNMRFYKTYGDYDSEEQPFSRIEFRYEDVNCIYYINSRYNEYGDRINRPSYVIYMNDGRLIDCDGYTSVKKTEKYILPVFDAYNLEIVQVDSDRDLPN